MLITFQAFLNSSLLCLQEFWMHCVKNKAKIINPPIRNFGSWQLIAPPPLIVDDVRQTDGISTC